MRMYLLGRVCQQWHTLLFVCIYLLLVGYMLACDLSEDDVENHHQQHEAEGKADGADVAMLV